MWNLIFNLPLGHWQYVKEDQLLRGVQLLWTQSFPSPGLVAVCPIIYPYLKDNVCIDVFTKGINMMYIAWHLKFPLGYIYLI